MISPSFTPFNPKMKKFNAVAHYTAKLPKAPSKPPILHLHSKKPVCTKLSSLPRRTITSHSVEALQHSFIRTVEQSYSVPGVLRTADLAGACLRVGMLSGTVIGESRTALLMECGGRCRIVGKKGRLFHFEWKGMKYFLVGDLMDSNRIVRK
ncbi:ribonuclease P [Trachipleistophora hominis]|uniref:Ribonuclease P n=1 Tax=Trachipleistophora hominis TaxID=72359 RepID=L7JVJ7_TRAHO|nr:ribonuclease P [Trachipleistophora hominis]